tara:strand:- start:260 stop:415 length:156 start_codon:yes stop_codon:yes gene_type:complete
LLRAGSLDPAGMDPLCVASVRFDPPRNGVSVRYAANTVLDELVIKFSNGSS